MTTPLLNPSFRGPLSGEPFWNRVDLQNHGAAEYKRAISDAVEILSDTRYDALQEIRKLGEKS